MASPSVLDWTVDDVAIWLQGNGHEQYVKLLCEEHRIDGKALLILTETDLKSAPLSIMVLGDVKRLSLSLRRLQLDNQQVLISLGYDPVTMLHLSNTSVLGPNSMMMHCYSPQRNEEQIHELHHMQPVCLKEFPEKPSCKNTTQHIKSTPVPSSSPPIETSVSAVQVQLPPLPDNFDTNDFTVIPRRKMRVTSRTEHEKATAKEQHHLIGGSVDSLLYMDSEHHHYTPPLSEDGRASKLRPEIWKALISLGYLFVVTWITAFVMVIVHDRVPDMKKYPPLPDIFLDNVPHIPWAFHMCEVTGTILLFIWLIVLMFHKHRFILLRRFFALSGTVFLLRCVTMLITSLSVPGTHLQCNPRVAKDTEEWKKHGELWNKIQHAYIIWRGAGMSIQGVRTCGDYMFSGHTVALTMLNFFITEYTPRHLYFVHTFTWLLNMFGIFFILSAHEHYSIDVFVAFYITSRLFLYYHTLANNQALMQRDSNRTRIWFPLFSFFESSVDGIIPNEYESPIIPLRKLTVWIKERLAKLASLTVHESQSRLRHSDSKNK